MVRKFLAHVRLLPAVMALGVALFVVKIIGIAHDARAQEYTSDRATTQPTAASADETDDTEASAAETDVLTSLSRRRSELDARARDLETQQELLAAAEKRVDDKINNLKALQSRIQSLLGERDAAEQKQIDGLVKTYASMRPRDAARIFDLLSDDVLLQVASHMKPDVLGAILAQMQPDTAQKLTVKLANRLTPADTPPTPISLPIAQAVAAALPSATNAQQAVTGGNPAAAPPETPAAAAPSSAKPEGTAATSNETQSSAK
jgi:flagellar motility protein MotE (MotC chaperone)